MSKLDIPSATSISVHVCEHGTMEIWLHDDADLVFAIAVFGFDEACKAVADMTERLVAAGVRIFSQPDPPTKLDS